jgi:hypothetical protein
MRRDAASSTCIARDAASSTCIARDARVVFGNAV